MNKNLFKLLTPGAQHLLKEMMDEYNNLLLEKAEKIAMGSDTQVSEISMRDLIEAKGKLSLENVDPEIKRWNRHRILFSFIGLSYVILGIVMYFAINWGSLFHNFNVQSLSLIIVVVIGLFFLCMVPILDLRMEKILKRNERFVTINYSFEIINIWNRIEQKGKELMKARDASSDNNSSFMSIYDFLTHELNSKEYIDAIFKIFSTRNKIVHDNMIIDKNEYNNYLDLSQRIISELDDRISTSITSIDIPDNVTWIGDSAFEGYYNLKYIKISTSVTKIGENAFRDCASLTSIEIPNSVTEIGRNAFSGCTSLTSIVVPKSVTKIGAFAFDGCKSLTSIEIPYSVAEIGDMFIRDCTSLKKIIVHEDNPYYCSNDGILYSKDMSKLIAVPGSIASIVIPKSVIVIGNGAFECCSKLNSIEIPESVTMIGHRAFKGCMSLTSIDIPNSVTVMGLDAFYGCTGLTSIVVSNSLTEIWDRTFKGCTSLSSIKIPNGVTMIGIGAFEGCTSLTTIEIPESLSKLEWRAFSDCTNLIKINLRHKIPIDLSASLEGLDLSKITLYVPKGTEDEYGKDPFYSKFGEKKTE